MFKKYFGTDGIRGRVNGSKINGEMFFKFGLAAGTYFKNTKKNKQIAVIAKDTRLSGYTLEPALVSGLASAGMHVYTLGPLPTNGLAMLTKEMRANMGIMITASHNPYYDNGLKLFGPDGLKLSDKIEKKIEKLIDLKISKNLSKPIKLGRVKRLENANENYIKILKKMGGKIFIKKTDKFSGEQCGNISVSYSKLKGINMNKSLSPFLIDEYPILSIAASCATGETKMNGVSELRYKESDRIKSIVLNLKKVGVKAKYIKDNIHIIGSSKLSKKNCKIITYGDHRIACSFMILALLNKKIEIDNEKCVSISYPNFKKDLRSILKK